MRYKSIAQPVTTNDGSNLVLKQLQFGFAKHIAASATIAKGKHHQGVFCDSTGPFKRTIRQAKMNRVVMYDTGDRRAWLTDGATALLHLLCCKLAAQYSPVLNYRDVTQQFQYADSNDPNASEAALCNPKNRKLVLDSEPDYHVEGEIINLFTRLQELVKAHDKNSEEWEMRVTNRTRLEGYSFRNIVDDVPLLTPKMVYLEKSSGDWMKFVRDTKAVVLMGRGFGELISARKSTCPNWASMPVGEDYLAAKISLLCDIAASEGHEEDFPFWLTQNTRWHGGGVVFEKCEGSCRRGAVVCCTRAQEIRPCKFVAGLKAPRLNKANTLGAVVFGRNLRMPRLESLRAHSNEKVPSPQRLECTATQNDLQNDAARKNARHEDTLSKRIEERTESSSSSDADLMPSGILHSSGMSSRRGRVDSASDTPPTSLQTLSRDESRSDVPFMEALTTETDSNRSSKPEVTSSHPKVASLHRKPGLHDLRGRHVSSSQSAREDDEVEDLTHDSDGSLRLRNSSADVDFGPYR